jgi:ABC-type sugar transport system ATPase subunit
MKRATAQNIRRLRIQAPGPSALARQLSGGNQQKVLFAKWLETKPVSPNTGEGLEFEVMPQS